MKKTLGLDLGSNSLGWAIVNSDSGKILDKGVVIFDEGIKREKNVDSLETPAATRRVARMGRRLKMRRRFRKFALLKTLIKNDMCPLSIEGLDNWKKHGKYPLNDVAFREWLSSSPEKNPYADRAKAAQELVDKYTLGRALYHLVQRRGFLSNRKDQMKDDESDNELGKVKGAIKDLTQDIENYDSNATLGQYFYNCFKTGKKIRTRYVGRKEHYEKEFNRIVEVQKLDKELVAELYKNIFYQRPLRSQKKFVGYCPLETKSHRCAMYRPEFEEFRMLSFVNNLRVELPDGSKRELTKDERQKAIQKFYIKTKYFKIKDLAKAIGKGIVLNYNQEKNVPSCSVSQQLNNLLGTKFDEFKSWKSKNGKYDYNAIIDALSFFDDDNRLLNFAEKKLAFSEEMSACLIKIKIPDGYANYSLKAINKILPFLREGYNLYFAQIFANLPKVLGDNVFSSQKEQILKEIIELYEDYKENAKQGYLRRNISVIPFKKRFFVYLQNKFGIDDVAFNKLYLDSATSNYKDCKETGLLPPVNLGMIRNPLVQRSMTVMRKLVNQLRKNGKIDASTHIHVELARSVNDRNTRMAFAEWQNNREKERAAYATKIQEAGRVPTQDLILRWQLAEEQNWQCLYTGKQISISDVLNEDSSFDIEHTIPRSKSGDDTQANKTLCFASYNRFVKKGQLPTECPNYNETIKDNECVISVAIRPWHEKVDNLKKTYEKQLANSKNISQSNPEAKAKARRQALTTKFELDYWREKLRRFTITSDDLGDAFGFMNRQLVDTGIMTSHAIEFLSSVYHRGSGKDAKPNVWPVNGNAVAFARRAWGVLDTGETKSRDNHIHHAIDAMVIANLNHERFHEICSYLKDDAQPKISGFETKVVAPPFEGFGQKVYEEATEILIRHLAFHKETKQTFRKNWDLAHPLKTKDETIITSVKTQGNTIRGKLHKETFYGKILSPETGEERCVVRKAIDSIEENEIEKIVDPAVRKTIKEQFEDLKKGKPDLKWKDAVSSGLWMKKPDTNGNYGVPINKVRVYTKVSSPKSLKRQIFTSKSEYKNNYYVDSGEGSNYKMNVYENGVMIDNILKFTQRKNKDIDAPEAFAKKIGEVTTGTMAIVYDKPQNLNNTPLHNLANQLFVIYKFENINSTSPRIHFRKATEARTPDKIETKERVLTDFSANYLKSCPHFYISTKAFLSHILIEGIHFTLSLDGEIKPLK